MQEQQPRVLEHLRTHGTITQLEAIDMQPKVMRLAEIIRRLKMKGHTIETLLIQSDSGGRYAKYVYIPEEFA